MGQLFFNSMFDTAENKQELMDSVNNNKLCGILSEANEPELFHCILNMMNDYNIPHKSNKHLLSEELGQIDILHPFCLHHNCESYFKDFNPKDGDYSVIFRYLKNIKTLDGYTFASCKNLITITIPTSIIKIGYHCFEQCSKLTLVHFSQKFKNFVNPLILGEGVFYNCENLSFIDIPNTITYLPSTCFAYCRNLKAVIIPKSVTQINSWCFLNCSELTSITIMGIPEQFTKYKQSCFEGCDKLKEITIKWVK